MKVTEWPPIGKIAAHSSYEMFSWYKYLIVSLDFSHLGFWSGDLFLIAPFPDLCLRVPLYLFKYGLTANCFISESDHVLPRSSSCFIIKVTLYHDFSTPRGRLAISVYTQYCSAHAIKVCQNGTFRHIMLLCNII